ncbi:MAG: hypothetical protein BWX54_01505 [Verrucomicrobia bacterium ADurb.Bin018]|nr:MAG: hypothetical protein BWX54_01505 [Verrucomicrobia bacterium ADurb.Bin018]
MAAFEGIVFENTLAEAVDGEDGGAVEVHDSELDALLEPVDFLSSVMRDELEGVADALLFRGECAGGRGFQIITAFEEDVAEAFAQFAGGGVGEGDHEDFADGEVFLEDEAEKDVLDVVGFAGTSAGFNELGGVEGVGGGKDEIGKVAHVGSYGLRCFHIGRMIVSAADMKSLRGSKGPVGP